MVAAEQNEFIHCMCQGLCSRHNFQALGQNFSNKQIKNRYIHFYLENKTFTLQSFFTTVPS